MSSAIFRQLASGGEAHKAERLFHAAISAFATLTRPTRSEIAQLDALTLPLFPAVPVEARRYAAAVLCECPAPPPGLLRRLCDEPIEISAPLLVRSKALSDVDLISLIAQHGLPHARVIGRRGALNPAIAALIRAMAAQEGASLGHPVSPRRQQSDQPGMPEQAVRDKLLSMMRATAQRDVAPTQAPLPSTQMESAKVRVDQDLRDAALADDEGKFVSALADRLGISIDRARRIVGFVTPSELMTGLRLLGLGDAEAFLIAATHFPAQLSNRPAIRLFVERYRALSLETAQRRLRQWQAAHPRVLQSGGFT
ncbi:hypothetical protein [Nitratireductor soli]|uniref:hypothetical protein n=1 Tax=Nitratireductor soli TaxID=1670619 RepID=UPI000AF87909|nr:hypothetical protein [Nitratireductor soli]